MIMIYESYPWKRDLAKRKSLIKKYNVVENFINYEERTYTVIEKAIFYSAFIIRKLIECGGKVSDTVDAFSLDIYATNPIKPVNMINRWPEEDSHDWGNEYSLTVKGKDICNWLIHSYIFYLVFNEDGIVESFSVTSDYDRNKILYRIPLDKWVEYMELVISDYVVAIDLHYDKKKKDYVFTRKERK